MYVRQVTHNRMFATEKSEQFLNLLFELAVLLLLNLA